MRAELRVSAAVILIVLALFFSPLMQEVVHGSDELGPSGLVVEGALGQDNNYYIGSKLSIRCFGMIYLYRGDLLVESANSILGYVPQKEGTYTAACNGEKRTFAVLGVEPLQNGANGEEIFSQGPGTEPILDPNSVVLAFAESIGEISSPDNSITDSHSTTYSETMAPSILNKNFSVRKKTNTVYSGENGVSTMKIGGGGYEIIDSNGRRVNFTEVVNFKWEGSRFLLSWNSYSAEIGVFFVHDGVRYSPEEIEYIFPGVLVQGVVESNRDYYKYGLKVINISENLSRDLEYVGFEIRNLSGISADNVLEKEGASIVLDETITLDFQDLLENFSFSKSSPTTILVENVSGKSELWIDPTIQLQAAGSDNLMDTYVSSAAETANYGTISPLNIHDRNTKQRTYIMFNISSLPSSVTINDSELCLYLYTNGATASATAHHVTTHTWNGTNETTTTWNIQPCGVDFNANELCNLTPEDNRTTSAVGWICWNVTNATRSEYAGGDANLSFALKSPETGNLAEDSYYSKEFSATSSRPYLNITYTDSANPQYSNINQSPVGNPDYGQSVQCNATWSDNVGLSAIYFVSNFSGSWQNYLPSVSGSVYNYLIPETELSGGESVGWYYWANDTNNNINDIMPIQTFTVQKAATTMAIYLNGTQSGRSYNYSESVNFTAQASVSGLNVEIWTNLSGEAMSLLDAGASPLTKLSIMDYSLGIYLIKANTSGNENYSSSEDSQVLTIVDGILPYVEIFSPQNDTLLNTSIIQIIVNGTDIYLDHTNISIINSTGHIVNSVKNLTNGTFAISLSVPGDDTYNITAATYDSSGNMGMTTCGNLTVDTFPPQVSINFPLNGMLTNQTSIDVSYNVAEAHMNITNVSVYNSTGSLINSAVNASTGTAHSYLEIYADGDYIFNITSYDLAGNINQSRGEFTRDTTLSAIAIISPKNNSYTNDSLIRMIADILEENINLTNLSVYNSTGSLINSTINISTGLVNFYASIYADGVYNINLTAYDKAYNIRSETLQNLTLDRSSPQISIISPIENSSIANRSIEIALSIAETNINLTNCTITNSTGDVLNSTTNTSAGAVHCYMEIYQDANINITATTYDLAGNQNIAIVSNITVDAAAPQYSSVRQNPQSPAYGDSIEANSTWTDNIGLDKVIFESNYAGEWQNYTPSASGSEYNYTIPLEYLPVGKTVSWKYWAKDISGNLNDSMLIQTFTVQKANSSMTLYLDGENSDGDYRVNSTGNFTAVLNISGVGIEMWTNVTGSLTFLDAGLSPLQNLARLDYDYGYYLIKANFSGNENYSASEANHTIFIKPSSIAISLISPWDNSGDSDGNISFYYNVSSPEDISNCSLMINSMAMQTDYSVEKDTLQNITVNGLNFGKYAWSIRCFDLWGAQNISNSRNISIILMNSFGGATTDLTNQDVSNINGFTIENPNFGKIVFNESMDISNGLDLESNVTFGQNYATINSLAEPTLNKSAELYLYNLSCLEEPVILRDGLYCPDCQIESYLGGTLTFNVRHFTNYSAASNSQGEIWDDTDAKGGGKLKYAGELVNFFANYTNRTSGEPINDNGAYCQIDFLDNSANMSYNYTSGLYEFNRSFGADGNYSWNVSCNGEISGYEMINLTDLVIIQTPYLEVTLTIPPTLPGGGEPGGEGDYLIGQNKTFIIRANATCRGGTCGTVQGFIRYNQSSSLPDTNLSAYSAEPVYVVNSSEGAAQNPIYCGTLGENDSCAVNWTINATGALNYVWAIDVGFNKTRVSNYTASVSIKITKVLLMSLSFNEVNFGIVNPATPSDQNPCPQNGNQYVQIDENSNDVGWLWIRGTDLQPQSLLGYGNISYNIGVENIYWYNESSTSSSKPLSSDYQMVDYNVKSGSNYGLYFWINAPGGLEAQEYRGTLYILANSTAD